MEKLSEGPVSVSQLAAPLLITLAAVVQHLQILEESGLVRTRRRNISKNRLIQLTLPRRTIIYAAVRVL